MRQVSFVIAALAACTVLLVSGCTMATPAPTSPPTPASVSTPPGPGSAPSPTSVPAAATPPAFTTCGQSAISLAFGKKLLGFASCAGLYISSGHPARVYMSPGQTIPIRGVFDGGGTISADNPGLIEITGSTITAVHAGETRVRFANLPGGCWLSSAAGKTKHVSSDACIAFVLFVR